MILNYSRKIARYWNVIDTTWPICFDSLIWYKAKIFNVRGPQDAYGYLGFLATEMSGRGLKHRGILALIKAEKCDVIKTFVYGGPGCFADLTVTSSGKCLTLKTGEFLVSEMKIISSILNRCVALMGCHWNTGDVSHRRHTEVKLCQARCYPDDLLGPLFP